jgi:DNA polymerase V
MVKERKFINKAPPLFTSSLPAGFPSPAEDHIDQRLDLNELLIRHPAATFFVRVTGDSMVGTGIRAGDILIIDRAVEPGHNRVVVAVIDGAFTVKRLQMSKNKLLLVAENPAYPDLEITEQMDFQVWGVATYVIHPLGSAFHFSLESDIL